MSVAGMAFVTDPAVLLQQATVWQQDGKLQQAEEAYRRVLALDPANAAAVEEQYRVAWRRWCEGG